MQGEEIEHEQVVPWICLKDFLSYELLPNYVPAVGEILMVVKKRKTADLV